MGCRMRIVASFVLACLFLATESFAAPSPPDAPSTWNAPPSAARVDFAAARISALLDRAAAQRDSFPAAALAIVTRDRTVLVRARGSTRAVGGRPVTLDTPFYVASETKSFVGLLAADLDERKVLPLDTSLEQVWPKLRLAAPIDASKITLRQLLSHQAPMECGLLTELTAYVRAVPAADYPRTLEACAKPRPPGFKYSNLGYIIYGAALEARTGRPWQAWLRREVFTPLGLSHAFARASGVPFETLTWRHQWSSQGWRQYPPKPDATMHAAGGVVISARDMGRWMQVNLREAPVGASGPSPASFRAAHARTATDEEREGDFACNGYSLGWNICAYDGTPLLVHGGVYPGVRSGMAIAPDLGVGVAVMMNSDSMTGTLSQAIVRLFFDYLHDDPAVADAKAEKLMAWYATAPHELAKNREEAVAKRRADAKWGGWTWKPAGRELAAYTGTFTNPTFGPMEVKRRDGGLEANLGAQRLDLLPAKPDFFGAMDGAFEGPDPFTYQRTAKGDPDSISWNGETFRRAASRR